MSKPKQKILLVEDDENLVRGLAKSLSEIGDNYEVRATADGRKALETLGNETLNLDLVVLKLEIPGINGLQILSELHNKGIWLPIIITTHSNLDEKNKRLKDFGIVDFIKKPFLPEELVIKIEEIMKNREKKDVIKNFSLPSILQLIDMEKRTGILTIKIGKENGRLFFKEGRVMDIEVKGRSRSESLEEFIHSFYEDREMSIEYINHKKDKEINMTIMELVMEASRIGDEKDISHGDLEPEVEERKKAPDNRLPVITGLLDSLKEVDSYVIADWEGNLLTASPGNRSESILNSGFYLWLIGAKMGNDLDLGNLSNLMCHFKSGKRFIKKYQDYIIILELAEITRAPVFKEKLNKHLNKLPLQGGGMR